MTAAPMIVSKKDIKDLKKIAKAIKKCEGDGCFTFPKVAPSKITGKKQNVRVKNGSKMKLRFKFKHDKTNVFASSVKEKVNHLVITVLQT